MPRPKREVVAELRRKGLVRCVPAAKAVGVYRTTMERWFHAGEVGGYTCEAGNVYIFLRDLQSKFKDSPDVLENLRRL